MKRILFVYLYCNLGGVSTVLKQRLPVLIESGWHVYGLFKADNGGAQDLEAAGMAQVTITGSEHEHQIFQAAKSGYYDLIVVIDDPNALRAALAAGVNPVYEIHTPIEDVLLKNEGDDLSQCPVIIVPSEWSKRWALSHFPQVKSKQIEVCPNIVDSKIFSGPKEQHPEFLEGELLWVGKIAKYKNWREVLRVAKTLLARGALTRLTLVTGGHIDQAASVDVLTEVANLEITAAFRWLHNQPYRVMVSSYRNAAESKGVLLSTSLAESFCYVIHEAMRAGLPVVASKVGAVTDVVRHRETGALYEPGDYEAASIFVEEMLGSSPLRVQCVSAARDLLDTRFSSENLRTKYLKSLRLTQGVDGGV